MSSVNKRPLVSVIVPVYGVEKYIEKCARSVFEQTYSDLEIIFVDDCTPDNSIAILKQVLGEYPQMKDKTQILSYPQNRGLAGARKFGLAAAHGDYVLQIDSDDYIAHNMVEEMTDKATEENADIVICDFNMIRNGEESHLHVSPSLNPHECMKQVLTGEVHGSVANKLIRRTLYTDNNIAPIQGLNMREDLSVMYRLLYFAKKLAYVPQPFYNYLLREGSISASKMSAMQQKNSQDLITYMNDFCTREQINDKGVLEAFNFFKASVKSSIMLYGDIATLNKSLYLSVCLKHYISHPTISISHKIMGVVSVLHVECFSNAFRYIFDILRRFRNVIPS